MTEDQKKIFDEVQRGIEEFMRETFGTELAEKAKEMPPEVSNCIAEFLASKRNEIYPDEYGCEIKDAGDVGLEQMIDRCIQQKTTLVETFKSGYQKDFTEQKKKIFLQKL